MSVEEWLPIVGYEGIYEVSNGGHVRRIAAASGAVPGAILKPAVLRKRGNYLLIGLSKSSVKKKYLVHRLVAEAFHGPSCMPLVRHLDGNPQNNRAENLRWGTESENAVDRVRHGTQYRGNQNTGKTHCVHGHEFTDENTYSRLDSQGRMSRKCRACIRVQSRDQESRRRDRRLRMAA